MKIKLINGTILNLAENSRKATDIVIDNGIIIFMGDAKDILCDETIDCKGKLIVPSFTDIHVHAFPEKTALGLSADKIGIRQGVSTVIDAGSAGCDDYPEFYKEVIEKSSTNVKAFINYSKIGLTKDGKELSDTAYFNEEKLFNTIREFKETIVGIKLRASGSVVGSLGMEAVKRGIDFARKVNLPVMIHVGNAPPALEEILPLLQRGDIITHIFHGKKGGILDDYGKVKKLVENKYQEGVLYDVGHGAASFDFKTAEKAIKEGLVPFTISSDIHARNFGTKVKSLAEVMTKCLICGMEKEAVLKAATINPGFITGNKTDISEGNKASLAVVELINKKTVYEESSEEVFSSPISFNILYATDKFGSLLQID